MTDLDGNGAEPRDPVDAVPALLLDDLDAGFVDLVRAHERVVYSVALRVTGHRYDAEDLAAEAFLRAYRALRGYDRDRIAALRPRAWLVTILLNTWRNALRDASRRPRQVMLSDALDLPAAGAGVEELVEGEETLRELAGLLVQLPPAQRVAVVLRHVVGLPMIEVAAALSCPEGTAKSYVSRGLARLRSAYPAPPPGVVRPFPTSQRRAAPARRTGSVAPVTDATPRIAARRQHP
ncbi:MAG: RNA polymerase sigma factor [Frankiaceae bacterium]